MLRAPHLVTINIRAAFSLLLSGFWKISSISEDTMVFNKVCILLDLVLTLLSKTCQV